MKIKVLSIFGTRPEAIKMAPLVKKLEQTEGIESVVCVTAQHREMLDQVLDIFDIHPDFDLNIMKQRQTLTTITSNAINGLDQVMKQVMPNIVLVHGDTSTTFAGALAAFYNKIPVGHVEAGLRTFDKNSPYPEEMNRRLTGGIADLHFVPTVSNKNNLSREGITEGVYITGNTVIDALSYTVKDDYSFKNEVLQEIEFGHEKIILLTAHRRENLGTPLESICNAAKRLVDENDDVSIIYPVHLNPLVQETVKAILGDKERIYLIDPVDVEDMHNLMNKSYMIMTDSGGIQEEAPALGKPVLVLRTETERPEAVNAGTVKVVGVVESDIFEEANLLIRDRKAYEKMAQSVNPYGDGKASIRIVDALLETFSNQN